jgi:glycosyltransferase involved in cell wall biosynthesis
MSQPALASIIIRTKNEERWISSCLQKVFSQTYKNIEVILVDNGSSDQTLNRAKEYPVKVVTIDDFYPGKAINLGIKEAQGEYIVCLSGHCIPVNEYWLEHLLKDIDDPKIAGIYGRQEPFSFSSPLDKRDLLTLFVLYKKRQVKDHFFHNANSAFRKEVWKKYPFNEDVTNVEDRIWGKRVIDEGFNILYEPNASVYHWHGINHDLNIDRATKIINILEDFEVHKTSQSKNKSIKDSKILAVIPKRSEIISEYTEPLLKITIEAALNSKFITDVIVATDDQKIAEIASRLGAEIPFMRPKELSQDYIDIFQVLSYTLDKLEIEGRFFDAIILLEDAYLFRPKDIIDNMIIDLFDKNYDTVVAGCEESRNIWQKKDGKLELAYTEEEVFTPTHFKESTSIINLLGLCCITRPHLIRSENVFNGSIKIHEANELLSSYTARKEPEKDQALAIYKLIN